MNQFSLVKEIIITAAILSTSVALAETNMLLGAWAGKGVVLTATAVPGGNSTVSYTDLVKFHNGEDGEPQKAYGKTVRVAVTAMGEIGYFAKRADAITFLCKSGNKTLRTNKALKGSLQGIVTGSEGWEGATVYSLKACEVVK